VAGLDAQDDIKEIKTVVHHIERRQLDQEARIAKVEGRQDGFDAVMKEAHSRLDEKIDGVGRRVDGLRGVIDNIAHTLKDHTKREDADRGKLFWMIVTILISILGFIGAQFFEHFTHG